MVESQNSQLNDAAYFTYYTTFRSVTTLCIGLKGFVFFALGVIHCQLHRQQLEKNASQNWLLITPFFHGNFLRI